MIAGPSWLSTANQRSVRAAEPAVFPGIDGAAERRDNKPSHILAVIFPFSGKHANGLAIGGMCTVGADVENVVELGFW